MGRAVPPGVIQLVLYIMYLIYAILGLVLTISGIFAITKKVTTNIAIGVIVVGVFMLLVGGASLYVTKMENWKLMCLVNLVNFALLVFLVSTALIGIFIGNGHTDPVKDFFDVYWEGIRVNDGALKENGVCYNMQSGTIETEKVFPSDCSDYIDFYGDYACSWANCQSLYAEDNFDDTDWADFYSYAGNCTKFESEGGDYDACMACDEECETNLIVLTEEYVQPLAATVFGFWFFFLLTLVMNVAILNQKDEEDNFEAQGIVRIGSLAFNGLILIIGLATCVVGIIGVIKSNGDGCPLEPAQKCPTAAFWITTFCGFGAMASAGMVIFGIIKANKIFIIVPNFVILAVVIALLVVVITMGLACGLFSESVTRFDSHWEEFRDNIRKVHSDMEDFCAYDCEVDPIDPIACDGVTERYVDFTKEECIDDLKEQVEMHFQKVGITCACIAGAMVIDRKSVV